MEALLTPALFKEVLLQCGLAGLLILACCWGFNIIMRYIAKKDELYAGERKDRESKFLLEMGAWREAVATALKNNTHAMEKLTDTMRESDRETINRYHLHDAKLTTILERLNGTNRHH